MRARFLILAAISAVSVAASQPWHTSARPAWENIVSERGDSVLPGDYAGQMLKYNFARLALLKQSYRVGFIGQNYQRFYIYFLSIRKDSQNPRLYLVRGKTRVKSTVCDFRGTMTLTGVRRFFELPDPSNMGRPKLQGVALFDYRFEEAQGQSASGLFKGQAALFWYCDSTGRLCYDDRWDDADFFINNAFEGTWTSHATGGTKTCNWGDFRIPNSGELDDGVGEFGPSRKYAANGWETYAPGPDTTTWWK